MPKRLKIHLLNKWKKLQGTYLLFSQNCCWDSFHSLWNKQIHFVIHSYLGVLIHDIWKLKILLRFLLVTLSKVVGRFLLLIMSIRTQLRTYLVWSMIPSLYDNDISLYLCLYISQMERHLYWLSFFSSCFGHIIK